ncbi:MAG TPA: hypothetical protein VL551_10520 [Actinospica sp.]|nr:hypothetical protein [Actinospica sp.]
MDTAAEVVLWCGAALDVVVSGRVFLRWQRRPTAPRRPSCQPTTVGPASPVMWYAIVPSDLWQSEAEVLAEIGGKLRRTRELIAEGDRMESLIEPGIRDVEDYLRRAADNGSST